MIRESDIQSMQKMYLRSCHLCPRLCGANRAGGQKGRCGCTCVLRLARAGLHLWEEPCLSGKEGSGTVFFSGCSLGCVFCQNSEIALGRAGFDVSIQRLSDIFLELQDKGANNINLVTACHDVPQTVLALADARQRGLRIPVVYNSSGYELPETLKLLEGLVDIYLPDFKYMDSGLARSCSGAADYPERAKEAVKEMVRQVGPPIFDERGIMTRGVIVRHLLLPGQVKNGKAVVSYLHQTYGSQIYISLMSQYTPMPQVKDNPLLSRRVTRREYRRLVDYSLALGLEQGFIQEGEAAKESFIPAFNGEGVRT